MSDPNFHGLRDEAARAAHADFDVVRRRARRLRSRRRAAAGGTALAVAVLLGVTGYAVTGGPPTNPPAVGDPVPAWPTVPAPVPSPERTSPVPTISGVPIAVPPRIRWAGAGDPRHLYAVVAACDTCPQKLMASEDGGTTWAERPDFPGRTWAHHETDISLSVYGAKNLVLNEPRRLTVGPDGKVQPPPPRKMQISTDGGVGWRSLTVNEQRMPSVPADGAVVQDRFGDNPAHGPIRVLDPASGTVGLLANQPPLRLLDLADVPASAGIWVQGFEPKTRKPAVAVSRDRGVTWAVSVFDAERSVSLPTDGTTPDIMARPNVATTDGTTAFAMFVGVPSDVRVYRSTDGGVGWQSVAAGVLGDTPLAGPESWVTADGSHVVSIQPNGAYTFAASRDGGGYEAMTPDGLPAVDRRPIVIDADHYLYRNTDHLYRSGDGRNWQAVAVPVG
ncbi:sialidase family protein [Plantactinospora sp. GCM10030261]|uniref:sialidase family protein n=1 Tax=Plantactinospora sp. GCM10030261 TaxID=3273420 RepID=UPI00360C5D42